MAENKPPLKISDLDPITAPTATSVIPISNSTDTNKITFADLTKDLAKKTDLNGLEKTTDLTTKLALKADKTELANLATKASVELKADKTALTPLAVKTEVESTYAKKTELTPITTAIGTIQEEIETLQLADTEIAPKVAQLIIDVNKLKQDVTKLQTDYVTLEGRVTALETPETP